MTKQKFKIWLQLNPGCTAASEPPTWVDYLGIERRTVRDRKDIHPNKFESHRALIITIFKRDKFSCQGCGLVFPEPADLTTAIIRNGMDWTTLEVDHIISLRNGGTSHPSNLQALCNRCNSRKSALFDSRYHFIFSAQQGERA